MQNMGKIIVMHRLFREWSGNERKRGIQTARTLYERIFVHMKHINTPYAHCSVTFWTTYACALTKNIIRKYGNRMNYELHSVMYIMISECTTASIHRVRQLFSCIHSIWTEQKQQSTAKYMEKAAVAASLSH